MMTADTMPPLRPFDGSAIPSVLKEQKRWAPWRAVWNDKRKKYDKIPHRADRPDYGLSTAKPEQWFSYDQALTAYQNNPRMLAGIGYVMTGPHGVVGTDLDNCVADGVVAPWALEVVQQLASYTEISPSGQGLRILSLGDLPADWNNHDVGLEVYGGNEARFLTVTGEHLAGTPGEVRAAPAEALQALETRYAKERRRAEVIDLAMPEILDDLLLPSVENLDIPYTARDFLETGAHRGDRSRELFSTAVALYSSGLPDDEVFSILASNAHAMEIALDHRRQDQDRALLYLWREHCCKGRARATPRITADEFDVVESAPATPVAPAASKVRFRVLSAVEFAQQKPTSWIIKGILPQAELCVLFGTSGSGKTFFTLDVLGAIVRGAEWRGKKVKKGRAVYVAAEGAGGFRKRMKAYCDFHGIDLADLDIGVIADAPNLMEKADIKDLVAAIQAHGKVNVIVMDTLAQVTPGANENSGDDMGRALAHCKLIHRATGALVILVHHSGKDSTKGARGWSGLRGAADAQIEIVRAGDDRAAVIDKQKDGAGEGDEYAFDLKTVSVGTDEDGEDITSCVLEHIATVPKAERKKEPKGTVEKLVLKVITELTELAGEGVHVTALMDGCVAQMLHDPNTKRDRRREVTLRAFESLQAANRVKVVDGLVVVL
jgi:hypothetical protein